MNIDLRDLFNNIKKSKWSKPIYISLTVAINTLLVFSGVCFAYVLMGFFIFIFPYLFGERSVKTIIKVGLIIILLMGIIIGVLPTYFMYTHSYYYGNNYVSDEGLILRNGTVKPYLGGENTFYNYSVEYYGEEGSILWVNITYYGEVILNCSLIKGAENLHYNDSIELQIRDPIYIYHFSAWNGTEWTETGIGVGPVNAPLLDTLGTMIFFGTLSMFMNVGLLFFLILILYWWTRKAKIERMKWGEETTEEQKKEGKERDGKKEEVEEEEQVKQKAGYTCTECGADVRADAAECPKCGAKFEGFEED